MQRNRDKVLADRIDAESYSSAQENVSCPVLDCFMATITAAAERFSEPLLHATLLEALPRHGYDATPSRPLPISYRAHSL